MAKVCLSGEALLRTGDAGSPTFSSGSRVPTPSVHATLNNVRAASQSIGPSYPLPHRRLAVSASRLCFVTRSSAFGTPLG
jgi:hypothetical protein